MIFMNSFLHLMNLDLGLFWFKRLDIKFSCVFIRYKDTQSLNIIFFYYIDTSVLLENITLVKFIKSTSGTRVVYFP